MHFGMLLKEWEKGFQNRTKHSQHCVEPTPTFRFNPSCLAREDKTLPPNPNKEAWIPELLCGTRLNNFIKTILFIELGFGMEF